MDLPPAENENLAGMKKCESTGQILVSQPTTGLLKRAE